jgi:hypothetical protein
MRYGRVVHRTMAGENHPEGLFVLIDQTRQLSGQ